MTLSVAACSSTPRTFVDSPMTWVGQTTPTLSPPADELYRYAPSILDVAPGSGAGDQRHVFMCGNAVSGVVRDHVVHRVLTRNVDLTWAIGDEDIAFGPSDEGAAAGTPVTPGCGTFDCYHTCDPELVRGTFEYDSVPYAYALFYTGNDFDGSTHNAIGVAFANDPDGPFTRMSVPVVPYDCGDGPPYSAGILQPSVVSKDGMGRLYVFTRNDCAHASPPSIGAALYELDLSRVARDQPPSVTALPVSTAGLIGYRGAADDPLVNGDWAYDAGRDRFFVVRHLHPVPPHVSGTQGNDLPYGVQLAAIPGADVRAGTGTWTVLGDVVPSSDGGNSWPTGFQRNHNAGLARDALGRTVETDGIEVGYTTCNTSDQLFGRKIFIIRGALDETWR